MQGFEFHCPGKIICGAHSLHKIVDELQSNHVERPLVMSDNGLLELGVVAKLTKILDREGVPYEVFTAIPPDSSLDVVNQVVAAYQDSGCDGFIALGGGSVIDTAKGAAASVAYEGVDFATLQGAEILSRDLPPLIAVPTTAGTGSEVTLVAVISDPEQHAKLCFTSYKLVPSVAILDPDLTSSLPPKLTATTGMDALTHAIEAYTSAQKNPISDAFATKAIELISGNLVKACEDGSDADARTAVALGSLLAGAAFSNAMVGIIHSIGHSLGGLCKVPHGQAMMILLPYCVDYNLSHGHHQGLYGELLPYLAPEVARTLGAFTTDRAKDELFLEALRDLNKYFHDTYGVPIVLSEVGLRFDQLEEVAKQARYDGSAAYNATDFSVDDALAILQAAL